MFKHFGLFLATLWVLASVASCLIPPGETKCSQITLDDCEGDILLFVSSLFHAIHLISDDM